MTLMTLFLIQVLRPMCGITFVTTRRLLGSLIEGSGFTIRLANCTKISSAGGIGDIVCTRDGSLSYFCAGIGSSRWI